MNDNSGKVMKVAVVIKETEKQNTNIFMENVNVRSTCNIVIVSWYEKYPKHSLSLWTQYMFKRQWQWVYLFLNISLVYVAIIYASRIINAVL